MIQSNINDWIDDKKPNILYFCLEWYKKKPLKEAYWSYKKPDDMITYKKMYLKSLGNIYIVGKIENNNNEIKFGVKTISNTNLLISNLQKCIRQGHYDLAIQSSIHILANNPILLLRRLPIIMLEDTYPHISINTIIWMMVVYGNWFPKLYHIQWLLGVVKMMCLNPLNLKTFKKDTLEFNIRNNNDYIDNVFIDDISMVLSIILRSEYGGMQSDIKMLYWYVSYIINIYNANNTTNTSYSNIQISPVKLKLLNIKK